MKTKNEFTCELRHGVRLIVCDTSKLMTVQIVTDFLGQAMQTFKHHRDVLRTEFIQSAPRAAAVRMGRRKVGTLQLSYPGKEGAVFLTAALWTDAVISAYCSVETVDQMLEDPEAWRIAVARKGTSTFLREVVGLLGTPAGALQAMRMMLEHSLERDLEMGHYKPGEVVNTFATKTTQSAASPPTA